MLDLETMFMPHFMAAVHYGIPTAILMFATVIMVGYINVNRP